MREKGLQMSSAANILALIPARAGSKGIPGKNFRLLAGTCPYERAFHCAIGAGIPAIVTTTDWVIDTRVWSQPIMVRGLETHWIMRPPDLAQDDTPMIAVVQHALAAVPGPPDQIIVLLQPTQPLRQPKHVQAAIALLQETGSDSVVSVVELPQTHSPHFALWVGHTPDNEAYLVPWLWEHDIEQSDKVFKWRDIPARRQDARPACVRDGTCYAFYRKTVTQYGTIYGQDVRPLIIPPEETVALDTPADWAEAERRLKERT